MSKKGYTHITIIGGDDRKDIVEKIDQYVDYPCALSFVSAGYRVQKTDIQANTVISQKHVSGTLLRKYIYSLMSTDEAFALMPESLTHKQKVQLYYDVLLESGYVSKKFESLLA